VNEASVDLIAATLTRRTDAFECFRLERCGQSIAFEAGKLRSAKTAQTSGVGVRVVRDGRLAVGGTGDPTAIDAMIDSTIQAAAFGDACEFAFAPPAGACGVNVFEPRVREMGAAELVAIGRRVLEQLADFIGSSDGRATLNVGVWTNCDRFALVNSADQRADYQTTGLGVSISVECFGDDDILMVWDSDEGCTAGLDVDALIARVRQKLDWGRTLAPAGDVGTTPPMIFTPQGFNALLGPLITGLDGRNVADGISPLADKLDGAPILDPRLTVLDDATAPARPGSLPFDDEGVPGERTVLIDAGRAVNFLLDLRSAAELGRASTGNAHRDLTSAPAPTPSNLIALPGETPLAQMIGDVADGLLIDYLIGAGHGNILAGDYSNTIGLGFRIRDGRIVGRVKDLSIAGNVYRDLARVTAIEDRNHWRGSTCLPHVRVDGVQLAG